MTREEKLLGFLNSSQYKPMNAEEIKLCLDVKKEDEKVFFEMLSELHKEGKILKNKKGMYKANTKKCISGKLSLVKTGGFVRSESAEDIFIKTENLNGAFEGDEVVVCVLKAKTADKSAEGYIERILKRGIKTIVGKYTNIYGICGFVPFDMRLPVDRFIILKDETAELKNGDMIICDIVSYPEDHSAMTVRFKERICHKTNEKATTRCLIKVFDIPDKFSEEALKAANEIPSEVPESEKEGREDFRKDSVITIDGEDARDLDDAVCVKRLENNVYRLFVHIADVSHYVKQMSCIDKDAQKRATSVYFPDMVIPMLPTPLSNGICSLNPNVDRLTLSVIIDIDGGGNFLDYKIKKGVIRSCERMDYKTVTSLLDNSASVDLKARYKGILPMLEDMRCLSDILKKRRINQGYISFDIPEVKFELDESGRPVNVFKYEAGISNEIIEQFMLAANEAIAKFGEEKKLPFVYRVHEKPDAEKEKNLRDILHFYAIHINGEITPTSVSDAISKLSQRDDFYAISAYILRCMSKARYDTENLGHFGLGCGNYLHFTSPIRRYPDLFVHRVISLYLSGELKNKYEQMQSFSGEAAHFSTEAELRAQEAEREADKLKACEYMSDFIGCTFDGVISSVADFGFFVTLSFAVDGFVPVNELEDDYYVYEKTYYRLIGKRTKRTFSLGDEIKVKLKDVDMGLRRIDFSVLDMKKQLKITGGGASGKKVFSKKIISDKKKSAHKGRMARKKVAKKKRR